MTLTITVHGTPAPQGSKRAYVVAGRARLVESSAKVKPWRTDVRTAALDAIAAATLPSPCPFLGPVALHIAFRLPRPAYHWRTGARANELKPTAPRWHDKRPDIDKLARSTCDALSEAGVWRDDSQVAEMVVTKVYADTAGATITVKTIGDIA